MKDERIHSKRRKKVSAAQRLLLLTDALLVVAFLTFGVLLIIKLTGNGPAAAAGAGGESASSGENASDGGGIASLSAAQQPATAEGFTGASGSIDFSALLADGTPAVAWLYGEGTVIDYPVMQGDDNEYFMARNIHRKKDANGAIYLDCRNTDTFEDSQVMIYGNPMSDGSMFGSLVQYQNQAYYDQHPSLMLYTPGKTYRIDIYAAHTASPAMSNYPIWFENDPARNVFIQSLVASSYITTNVTVSPTDKLISLVTASDFSSGENSRFVLRGVLVPVS